MKRILSNANSDGLYIKSCKDLRVNIINGVLAVVADEIEFMNDEQITKFRKEYPIPAIEKEVKEFLQT